MPYYTEVNFSARHLQRVRHTASNTNTPWDTRPWLSGANLTVHSSSQGLQFIWANTSSRFLKSLRSVSIRNGALRFPIWETYYLAFSVFCGEGGSFKMFLKRLSLKLLKNVRQLYRNNSSTTARINVSINRLCWGDQGMTETFRLWTPWLLL
jgi:hypothetical protein